MPDILTQLVRFGPALALALVGGTLVVGGLRSGPADWLAHPGAGRAFVYLYTFRRVVVGLALIATAVGWLEQIGWLVAASVTIGIGEWLESSYYLLVMNRFGPGTSGPPARALRTGP
jgi:hypothetical protein